ncbi:phosphate signaling complex PhoU family protein [Methanocaldococcus indicus]|uniref:phosphate signaling complex PhoU family protein n=1 Tax=Methanocaldococcus indicus TaxID=213231 RepID=UPI003C6D3EA0
MPIKFNEVCNEIVEDIENLTENIINLLESVTDSYFNFDKEMAKSSIIKLNNLYKRVHTLESKTVKVLCLYRPVSKDLRFIIVIFIYIRVIEHIIINLMKICRITIKSDYNFDRNNNYLRNMRELIKKMLKLSYLGITNNNIEVVDEIYKIHKKIEKIYYKELHREMMKLVFKDVFNIAFVNELTTVGKYLERIENYITDFRNDIYFFTTGQKVSLDA